MGRLCRSFLSHSQCPGYNASDVGDGVGTVRLGVGRYHWWRRKSKKEKRVFTNYLRTTCFPWPQRSERNNKQPPPITTCQRSPCCLCGWRPLSRHYEEHQYADKLYTMPASRRRAEGSRRQYYSMKTDVCSARTSFDAKKKETNRATERHFERRLLYHLSLNTLKK